MTTSAEAQEVEDRLGEIGRRDGEARGMSPTAAPAALAPIDATLVELAVPTDEWDILYRIRLQVERDLLAGAQPGTALPAGQPAAAAVAPPWSAAGDDPAHEVPGGAAPSPPVHERRTQRRVVPAGRSLAGADMERPPSGRGA